MPAKFLMPNKPLFTQKYAGLRKLVDLFDRASIRGGAQSLLFPPPV
jgi:hypothetical protein